MFDSAQPYVSILWDERGARYLAQFWNNYKLVEEKQLTSDEEEALSTYVSFVEDDKSMDIPAKELWDEYHDGELLFDSDDSNFLWMLRKIMPEPEEVN